MTQTVLVALVVLLAVAYMVRRAWATLRPRNAPGCGDGCGCSTGQEGASGDWARS